MNPSPTNSLEVGIFIKGGGTGGAPSGLWSVGTVAVVVELRYCSVGGRLVDSEALCPAQL